MDTPFRVKNEPSEVKELTAPSDKSVGPVDTKVEVPYLDYEKANSKPFSVSYFNLGDLWDDPQGGFYEEIQTIEGYLKRKVESGDIADTKRAVENELKNIEKINNLKNEDRTVVKIGTLASYVKFLNETEKIKYNYKKYVYK